MLNSWVTWKTIKEYLLSISGLVEHKRVAVTGWSDGSVYIQERPNYIRVRFLDDFTEAEIWNDGVPLIAGLQVYVYSDGELPPGYRARYPSKNYGKDLAVSFTKPHARNHGYYSVDPSMSHVRQLLPFHPSVDGPWTIKIRSGWIRFGSDVLWYSGGLVDLTTSRPASEARLSTIVATYELVASVKTVKMIVVDGDSKPLSNLKVPTDMPAIPDGPYYPICSVKLSGQRAKLQDKEVGGDLFDLRFAPIGESGSGGGGTIVFPPNRVIISDENGDVRTDGPYWNVDGNINWSEDPDYVSPDTTLLGYQIFGQTKTPGISITRAFDGIGAGTVNFLKFGGTLAVPLPVLNTWRLGSFSFGGSFSAGAIDAVKARLTAIATEDWTDTARGTGFALQATPNGTTVIEDILRVYGDNIQLLKTALGVTPALESDANELATTEWVRSVMPTVPVIPETRKLLTSNLTIYVDKSGVDTNDGLSPETPFLTIYRANKELALIDKGQYTATVQIGAGIWDESISELNLGLGEGTTTIRGTLRELARATMATVSAGTTTIRGTVTKVGAFTLSGMTDALVYFVTDNKYRLIESYTNDVLTLNLSAPSATTQDVIVYALDTRIKDLTFTGRNLVIDKLWFYGSTKAYTVHARPGSSHTISDSRVDYRYRAESDYEAYNCVFGGTTTNVTAMQNVGSLNSYVIGCNIYHTALSAIGLQGFGKVLVNVTGGNIVSAAAGGKGTYGILGRQGAGFVFNASINLGRGGETFSGKPVVKNWTTGLRTQEGAGTSISAIIGFETCDTNTSADAATFSFIG